MPWKPLGENNWSRICHESTTGKVYSSQKIWNGSIFETKMQGLVLSNTYVDVNVVLAQDIVTECKPLRY